MLRKLVSFLRTPQALDVVNVIAAAGALVYSIEKLRSSLKQRKNED